MSMITARDLRQVAHNVRVEPHLQPVTGAAFRHRIAQPSRRSRLGWMLRLVVCGVADSSASLSMYGCSTLLRLRIVPPPSLLLLVTDAMNKKSAGSTKSEYTKSSMPPSFPLCLWWLWQACQCAFLTDRLSPG